MKIIWHWLVLAIALIAAKYFLPATIAFSPMYIVLVVAACLMFINMTIKPLISLLTLPINIITLGIFGILLNGAILWGLTYIIPGFHLSSFKGAVIAALIISVLNWILEKVFH